MYSIGKKSQRAKFHFLVYDSGLKNVLEKWAWFKIRQHSSFPRSGVGTQFRDAPASLKC